MFSELSGRSEDAYLRPPVLILEKKLADDTVHFAISLNSNLGRKN